MKKIDKHILGILGMFFASICFGLMAFFVRIVSSDVPNFVTVFVRSTGGMIVFLLLYFCRIIPFRPMNKTLLFMRGLFGVIALTLWFYSIGVLSLPKAVFYFYSFPLFTAIFARVFYHEKIFLLHILGMASVMIGLVFLSEFWKFALSVEDLLAVLSAIFAAAAITTIRELRKTEDSWTIVMVFLVMSSLTTLPFAAGDLCCFSAQIWLYMICIALIATLGQVVMTFSFKYCSATQGSIVSSTAVVFPVTLGYLFLGEKLSYATLTGGILILTGGILASFTRPREVLPARRRT